ncbi:MAG: methyltransferase domain-containing protein [Phycisphaerales bacterium]|nr:methyltransferase domain-containing protein [Phycisphaerales bacterium]
MTDQKPTNRPDEWLANLTQLGDLARVRLLRLVERTELGVGELATAAQLPQSTVSRHLKALHDHGWIIKRSEGTASLYRLDEGALDPDFRQLWETTRDRLAASPVFADDASRLKEVLGARRSDSRAFFGRIGGEWHELRHELFGTGFGVEAMLGFLDPSWVVADLGCGTGDAAERLAPVVAEVIAVDREASMLDASKKRLREFDNIRFLQGDLMDLPLEAQSVDAAVMMLVLHHLSEPAKALLEAAKALRPGGVVLVVDMVAHDRETYRQTMGHEHLGFQEDEMRQMGRDAGFDRITWRRLRPVATGKGPGLFAAAFFKAR